MLLHRLLLKNISYPKFQQETSHKTTWTLHAHWCHVKKNGWQVENVWVHVCVCVFFPLSASMCCASTDTCQVDSCSKLFHWQVWAMKKHDHCFNVVPNRVALPCEMALPSQKTCFAWTQPIGHKIKYAMENLATITNLAAMSSSWESVGRVAEGEVEREETQIIVEKAIKISVATSPTSIWLPRQQARGERKKGFPAISIGEARTIWDGEPAAVGARVSTSRTLGVEGIRGTRPWILCMACAASVSTCSMACILELPCPPEWNRTLEQESESWDPHAVRSCWDLCTALQSEQQVGTRSWELWDGLGPTTQDLVLREETWRRSRPPITIPTSRWLSCRNGEPTPRLATRRPASRTRWSSRAGSALCMTMWQMSGDWSWPVAIEIPEWGDETHAHTPASSCWPLVMLWRNQRLRMWIQLMIRSWWWSSWRWWQGWGARWRGYSSCDDEHQEGDPPEAGHGTTYVPETPKTEVMESSTMLSADFGTPGKTRQLSDDSVVGPFQLVSDVGNHPACAVDPSKEFLRRLQPGQEIVMSHIRGRCEGDLWTWEWGPAAFGGIVQLLWSFQRDNGKTWEGSFQERVGTCEWTGQSIDSSSLKHPIGLNTHGCGDWLTSSLGEDGWRFDSGNPRLEQDTKGIVPDCFQEAAWFTCWTVFQWRSICNHAWSHGRSWLARFWAGCDLPQWDIPGVQRYVNWNTWWFDCVPGRQPDDWAARGDHCVGSLGDCPKMFWRRQALGSYGDPV